MPETETHIEIGPLLDDGPDGPYNDASEHLSDAIRDLRDNLGGVTHLDYHGQPVGLLVPYNWQDAIFALPEPRSQALAQAERRAHPMRIMTPVDPAEHDYNVASMMGAVRGGQPLDRIAMVIALLVSYRVIPQLEQITKPAYADEAALARTRNWLRTGQTS